MHKHADVTAGRADVTAGREKSGPCLFTIGGLVNSLQVGDNLHSLNK